MQQRFKMATNSNKRDWEDVYDDECIQPKSNKRSRQSNGKSTQQHTQGKLDPTFGQRSAIPGLDDYQFEGDDELEYGEDMDAISYLRSVR